MGLENSDRPHELGLDQLQNGAYGNVRDDDERVRADYRPKKFRGLRLRMSRWPIKYVPQEAGLSVRASGVGFGTLYGTFIFGTAFGFLLACLLGLLQFQVFDWAVALMKPVAQAYLRLSL